MPIQTIVLNVEIANHEPPRERCPPFENFFPSGAPKKLARLARPKFGGLRDGFAIHTTILIKAFNASLLREIFRRSENALLDKMRFDVVLHEQPLYAEEISRGKRCFRAV